MAPLKRTLLGFVFAVVCASAAPLCTAVVATATDFEAQGITGCQFGNNVFYNFTYSYAPGGGTPVPGSAVTVQFSELGNQPTMPVVSFFASWDTVRGQQGDVRIAYSVLAPVSAMMYSSTLTLSGYVSDVDISLFNTSYISGAETICCPGPGNSVVKLNALLAPPNTQPGLQFQTQTDQVFYAPTTQISVLKDIFIYAGDSPNQATLTRIDEGLFEQGVSLPEPTGFFLLGGGLILLAGLSKRAIGSNTNRKTA